MKIIKNTRITFELLILFAIITSTLFIGSSCSKFKDKKSELLIKNEKKNSLSSKGNTVEKDIMTEDNKKLFDETYVTPFYLNMDMEYTGDIISSEMGNKIFLLSINNNNHVNIDKYNKGDQYILPKDIGDQIIKNRFNIKSIDYSKISYYNSEEKAYIIDIDSLGQGAYICTVINSIKQVDDSVVVTADFYTPDESTSKPDYSNKLETLEFTLRNNDGFYLYEQVKIIWKSE